MKGVGGWQKITLYTQVWKGSRGIGGKGLVAASSLSSGYVRPVILLLICIKALYDSMRRDGMFSESGGIAGDAMIEEDRWSARIKPDHTRPRLTA